jgi:SnoaL-like domain
LSVFIVSLATITSVAYDKEAEKEIRGKTEHAARALERKDYPSFSTNLSDDYHFTFRNGTALTREETLAAVKKELDRSLAPVRINFDITKMVVDGQRASTHVSEMTSYRLKDRNGKLRQLRYAQEFEETWVETPEGWRVSSTNLTSTPTRYWIDGKQGTRKEYEELLGE